MKNLLWKKFFKIKQNGKDNVILDWWGLPKTDIINQCDYVAYIDVEPQKRLEALKRREKYITQDDIDKRDEVLSVDYDRYDYDISILNDHEQTTVDETIEKIKQDLKTPTLNINMHLDEFEAKKQRVIEKQNIKLENLEPSKVLAYKMLINYRKIKNTLELKGSFKKELSLSKTSEEIEEYEKICQSKLDKILNESRKIFGEEIEMSDLEEILIKESEDVLMILENCKQEIKQIGENTNLTITSSIYVSPENLTNDELQTSKDVLNVAGELGNWVFAQSGTLVDNPYLLRKSGQGVLAREGICIPGDTNLIETKNGRVMLNQPVYVYLMKTKQFEPVVTVDYMENGKPGIRFEGEWTSDKNIPRKDTRVKEYTDITEMLSYLQLFSAKDKKIYEFIANLPNNKIEESMKKFLSEGKIRYINEECRVNVKEQLLKEKYKTIDEILEEKQDKYRKILEMQSPEAIKKSLQLLEINRKRTSLGEKIDLEESISELDEETKKVFDFMKEYQKKIKELFISRNESITHITDISPENMRGSKISKSINRANNYETQRGDWVFASSTPINGKNPYLARKSKTGMIQIKDDMYIYGGDNIKVEEDELGKKRVLLKQPNYIYEINPENFTPVVTLKLDEKGKPYFEFSEEWISENEVEINKIEQVRGVKEISDITDVVKNYQVLCDVNMTQEASKLYETGSIEAAMIAMVEAIKDGRLRYINEEAGINHTLKTEPTMSRSVVTAFAKETEVQRENENAARYNEQMESERVQEDSTKDIKVGEESSDARS